MNRPSFRKGSISRVGGLLNSTMDGFGIRGKVMERQAMARWKETVGPHIASSTMPETVRDGILFVCCKSSMWANELSLHRTDIISRLNKAVGKKVISDIRFTARGFRSSTKETREEDTSTRAKGLENIRIDEAEEQVAERLASSVPSKELAEKIKKAILTSKKLTELKRMEGYKKCPKCSALHNGKYDICDNCR